MNNDNYSNYPNLHGIDKLSVRLQHIQELFQQNADMINHSGPPPPPPHMSEITSFKSAYPSCLFPILRVSTVYSHRAVLSQTKQGNKELLKTLYNIYAVVPTPPTIVIGLMKGKFPSSGNPALFCGEGRG